MLCFILMISDLFEWFGGILDLLVGDLDVLIEVMGIVVGFLCVIVRVISNLILLMVGYKYNVILDCVEVFVDFWFFVG